MAQYSAIGYYYWVVKADPKVHSHINNYGK